ncbi:hypothetical protein BKA64DRAFT_395591 [Cadophora sp. MPI-SDFR-AT-0126]|nr:hypothetical protein BKA64DRAFT_395591 [Leotiomycetes sp. MPI-SDFR-AT-0126]
MVGGRRFRASLYWSWISLDPNCQCLSYRSASTVVAVIAHASHRMCGLSGRACICSVELVCAIESNGREHLASKI